MSEPQSAALVEDAERAEPATGSARPWLITLDRHTGEWIKGFAILLMFAHHLFGLPKLIEPPNAYVPLLPGVPLEYWIGRFGKICVAMFLLLSGYGFAAGARVRGVRGWRYFAEKAWRFLLAYWPYFLLAFVVGSLFFQERLPNGNLRFPTDPAGIVLNGLTLRNNFAFEWWFAETYLLLVVATRPLLLLANARPILLLGASIVAFMIGAAMDMLKIDLPVVSLSNLLIWQLPWIAGILLAQLVRTPLTARLTSRGSAVLAVVAVLIGFAIVETVAGFAMTPYLILAAPAFFLAIVILFEGRPRRITKGLAWLGGMTLGLWLVHPFFCYYFFQDAIYAPRYSPLVFAALLFASLVVVVPVEAAKRRLGLRFTAFTPEQPPSSEQG